MEWELLGPSPATAARHHYSLETMRIGLEWVCQANTSFRAAAKCFLALARVQPPSFWTLRLWVLRLGLYELRRPKERAADWVFIVDATIAVGQHKAVVVLGVRLAQMEQRGFNLGHQDVVVLAIRIVSRCHGAVVQEALVSASQAVGVPQAVAHRPGFRPALWLAGGLCQASGASRPDAGGGGGNQPGDQTPRTEPALG